MKDPEAIDMMQRCVEEITGLRREIERLQPKAEAYAVITAIVGLLPRPSMSAGEDITWLLRKKIEELRAVPEDAPTSQEAQEQ